MDIFKLHDLFLYSFSPILFLSKWFTTGISWHRMNSKSKKQDRIVYRLDDKNDTYQSIHVRPKIN